MKGIIEYRSGDIDEIVGIRGDFGTFVEGRLEMRPDAVRIWCVMDELGEEWDADAEPYWTAEETAEILRVVRPAGGTAKVVLPARDGDDLWSAIERSYPEAWDLLEPGDIDVIGDSGIQLDAWDVMFSPGEGKSLAEWFAEVPEAEWRTVMNEADLGEWDEGRDMKHPIQPGKWRGHRIEIVYGVPPDADTGDWGDEDWLAAVESIRIAEGE